MRRLPGGAWVDAADVPEPLAFGTGKLVDLQPSDRGQRPRGLHLAPRDPDAVRDALRENV